MKITRFEIDMLNVKAADAMLIHAFVDNGYGLELEYVVLVDAGNEGDGEIIYNHIQKYYTQHYIDLAIITHCDSDHYGGMQYLIKKHLERKEFCIKQVWVHDPYKHVNVDDVKYIRNKETLRERLNAAYSFSDGSNLLDLLDSSMIPRKEVFSGDNFDSINILVLGPSKEYYESLIPEFRVDLDFKDEQPDDKYPGLFSSCQTEDEYLSRALEDAHDDRSKVNQSSIIFLLVVNSDYYLFTGDAGKEALHKIVDWDKSCKNCLKDIKWMKIPHHGSKHNLDNGIISHFHPKVSCISTEKYQKYANICTVNALKKVGIVYSTHKNDSSLWYHEGTKSRDDYDVAEML